MDELTELIRLWFCAWLIFKVYENIALNARKIGNLLRVKEGVK